MGIGIALPEKRFQKVSDPAVASQGKQPLAPAMAVTPFLVTRADNRWAIND